MEITKLLAGEAILTGLGERIARSRLDMQLTQADVAEQAGVSRRTVERIESGASAQMSSPMALLRHKGKVRQRASGHRYPAASEKIWTWDEDT